jgi:hypothetical protein
MNYPPGVTDNDPYFNDDPEGKYSEEESWPDIIGEEEEPEPCEEYGKICDAVGDLTAAILEARLHKVLTPTVASSIHGFLTGVLQSLEEYMVDS